MAYSPRLWLMAIGRWNKINQCRNLKLNLTQTWGVCTSLNSGMHWSQNQWYCDDKPRKEQIQSSQDTFRAQTQYGLLTKVFTEYRVQQNGYKWLQWGVIQWGMTFSQVVWLIGCWLVSASHNKFISSERKRKSLLFCWERKSWTSWLLTCCSKKGWAAEKTSKKGVNKKEKCFLSPQTRWSWQNKRACTSF